jgi:hypothetical protein
MTCASSVAATTGGKLRETTVSKRASIAAHIGHLGRVHIGHLQVFIVCCSVVFMSKRMQTSCQHAITQSAARAMLE